MAGATALNDFAVREYDLSNQRNVPACFRRVERLVVCVLALRSVARAEVRAREPQENARTLSITVFGRRLVHVAEGGMPVRGRIVVGEAPFRLLGCQLDVTARGFVRAGGREMMGEMADARVCMRRHVRLDCLGDAA